MSENHLSNLLLKLSEMESKVVDLKKQKESTKRVLSDAVNTNQKMRDIEVVEEHLDYINSQIDYTNSTIASLRRRIKKQR